MSYRKQLVEDSQLRAIARCINYNLLKDETIKDWTAELALEAKYKGLALQGREIHIYEFSEESEVLSISGSRLTNTEWTVVFAENYFGIDSDSDFPDDINESILEPILRDRFGIDAFAVFDYKYIDEEGDVDKWVKCIAYVMID